MNSFKETLKLMKNQIRVSASEDLCNKRGTRAHDKWSYVEGCDQKLGLDKLVEVV